jgi:hypothetical protein
VAPVRTIAGSATGLSGQAVTGLAVNPATGALFVVVKPSPFSGPGAVEVFRRGAKGDTAPVRTFTDQSTSFDDAEGIAVVGAPGR